MKRVLMVAGCTAIAAMAAFAGTNQVASAAQGKGDVRAEAKREREAQRKALEMIQGELKRQREGHATKVGCETHINEPDRTFARQIKFAKAQDIMRALSVLVMESTKGAEMALNQGALEKNAMIKRNEAMYLSGMPGGNEGAIRGKVLLLADDRTNKLIVITRKANMDIFDSVIAELDVEVIPANGNSP